MFLMKGDKRCTLWYIHWFAQNVQGTNVKLMHFVNCNGARELNVGWFATVTYRLSVGQLICCNSRLQWIYHLKKTSAIKNKMTQGPKWALNHPSSIIRIFDGFYLMNATIQRLYFSNIIRLMWIWMLDAHCALSPTDFIIIAFLGQTFIL